jgi:hypothetical protein
MFTAIALEVRASGIVFIAPDEYDVTEAFASVVNRTVPTRAATATAVSVDQTLDETTDALPAVTLHVCTRSIRRNAFYENELPETPPPMIHQQARVAFAEQFSFETAARRNLAL